MKRGTPGRQAFWAATGWARVIAATTLGTLFCVLAAVAVDSVNFDGMTPEEMRWSVFIDVALPTALAGPLLFFLTYKMRQLAIAYAELLVVASTDSLTRLLNRHAFTVLAETFLARTDRANATAALLIIDADNFKQINDEFGHERGDVALQIIARAIRATLREADLVGRIGGEEFAVLLQGTDARQAEAAAERIRLAIRGEAFQHDGIARALTVSVGGVTFHGPASYDRLFVAADHHLYAAKAGGRDQVRMGPFPAAAPRNVTVNAS